MHRKNTYLFSEKKNHSRGIVIGRSIKEERKRHPEITEAGTGGEVDETRLYQNRFCDGKFAHCPKDMPVS